MRQNIFNADDAGIDEPRNEGIIRAFRNGCVRSATALVNGDAFGQILSFAKAEAGLGLGLHLNLTDGEPLTRAKGLAPSGSFRPKRDFWARAWKGVIPEDEVAAEFRAQIDAFLGAGLVPTHLDGHNHIHVFPGVWEVLKTVMNEFPEIKGVRLPGESGPVIREATSSDGVPEITPTEVSDGGSELEKAGHRKAAFFRTLADRALRSKPRRMHSPGEFAGIVLAEHFTVENLKKTILEFSSPIAELMTHPGLCTDDSVKYSANPDRENELRLLTSPDFLDWLSDHAVAVNYSTADWGKEAT